jgi:excinuclease ABC subunit B
MIDGVHAGRDSGTVQGPATSANLKQILAVSAEERAGDLGQLLKQLEEQMYQYARDLEFEQAAAVRDQLMALKQQRLGPARETH